MSLIPFGWQLTEQDAQAQIQNGHGRAVRTAELSMALFGGTVLIGASIVAICQRVEDRL